MTNVLEKPADATIEPGQVAHGDTSIQIKARVHRKLLNVMDLNEARRIPLDQLHTQCAQRVNTLLLEEKVPLSGPERQQIVREVMDEVFGYGPLDEFLRDPLISDVLVNGPHRVYIERQGRLESTGATPSMPTT
jgi:pilus assembly protein CpaF